jgi:hypothetical protein
MGIEAFGVSMRFTELGVYVRLRELLENHPRINIGNDASASGCVTAVGEYEDDKHVIDLQISREVASDRCTMAIRFSLCSYESIDAIFIDIVDDVLVSFEADVWLMTSALKQKTNYLPGDQSWLIAALPDEIASMRDYWQRSFGNKQGRVRVKDSFSFAGLKFKQ